MHTRKNRFIACLCLAVLCLAGCQQQTEDPSITESQVWETMPALTYGEMEYEKLGVLSWNSGRCEATSCNTMAETALGFYYSYLSQLRYADKSNLENWVVVCGQPDCDHSDAACDGHMVYDRFIIRDGRIVFEANAKDFPQLYTGNASGIALFSMSANGKDKKLEYVLEDAMALSAYEAVTLLTQEHWLYIIRTMDKEGAASTHFFRVTGTDVADFSITGESYENFNDMPYVDFKSAKSKYTLYGDGYFYTDIFNSEGAYIYRFVENSLVELDTSGLPVKGGYLSGNILRCFRPNDGYYDINTETGEEVKLTEARLENSLCAIVLPNCIVESTLLYPASITGRTSDMDHSIEIFDGETWHSVKLPEELENASQSVYITVQAITSDSILIACRDRETQYKTTGTVLYRISLGSDEFKMEDCTEFMELG